MVLEGLQQEQSERGGPASVVAVMDEFERQAVAGNLTQFQPTATGFSPLDEVLNGGLRPGELMVIGGPYGVGKTVLGLQIARNVARADARARALYVCYEHDRTHLLSRLLCLESAELGHNGGAALTLRKLAQLVTSAEDATRGPVHALRRDVQYRNLIAALEDYGERLILARASGAYTTLYEIQRWVEALQTAETDQILVVIDYLQKVAVDRDRLPTEEDVTTFLMHGLKELALSRGLRIIAITAADRAGMQGRRMRLSDLRGSSAIQYESDIGIVLNNKYNIVSREHLIYNLSDAETMRSWLVLSLEKNRAGRHAVDMEFAFDAAHFRLVPQGDFVRERLIDGKAVIE